MHDYNARRFESFPVFYLLCFNANFSLDSFDFSSDFYALDILRFA